MKCVGTKTLPYAWYDCGSIWVFNTAQPYNLMLCLLGFHTPAATAQHSSCALVRAHLVLLWLLRDAAKGTMLRGGGW